MASTCKSECVNDTRVPVRATYVNLYKWPESDREFVRSVSSHGRRDEHRHPKVVDSYSCRQLYLRSYTFSRKESVPEKTKKCFGRIRNRVVVGTRNIKSRGGGGSCDSSGGGGCGVGGRKKCVVIIRRTKKVSCAALVCIFRRLMSCTTKIDVVG